MSERPEKTEIWVAEHAVPLFMAIASLIVLGAIAVFVLWEGEAGTAERVKVLTPQVTRIDHALCDSRSSADITRARLCGERIRYGLIVCARSSICREAFFALLAEAPEGVAARSSPPRPSSPSATTPSRGSHATPEGVMPQPPSSHGHQQPGPSTGPTGEAPHEPPSAVSPSPAPASPGSQTPESPAETPPAAPQPAPTPPKVSAPAVEVCVLGHTCVGLRTGLGVLPEGEG